MGEEVYAALSGQLIDSAHHYFAGAKWYELRCAGGINRLLEVLLEHVEHAFLTDDEVLMENVRYRRMQRIADHIDAHMGEKILLSDVAEEEGLTLNYLSHFVRESFGMSFQDVVQRKRCQKAAALLVDTEESPTEISLICGFSALKYMNRGFEKLTGCSPSEYRARARAGVDAELLELAQLDAQELEAARNEGGTRSRVPHFSHDRALRYLERNGWINGSRSS